MGNKDNEKQLEFKELKPPKEQEPINKDINDNMDVPSLAIQQNALPESLKASAEASIDLRKVQRRLAEILTREEYVSAIASEKPEVLPSLMESITGGIAVADNLMIKTMQEASKNSTTNKLLEYMVQQQSTPKQSKQIETNEYYDESIDKIKQAIFHKLDKERNKSKRTARDYIDPKDTEVIEADYKEIEEDNNE